MKLVTVLLLMTIMQVSANGFAQKITLHKTGMRISEIFEEIKGQTGYDVLYQPEKLKVNKRIYANFNSTPLAEVVSKCLDGQPLTYTFYEKSIVIKEKDPKDIAANTKETVDIKGLVTDEKGGPLVGVSVTWKGTKVGAISNSEGRYSIKTEPGAVLVFSYIGYEMQEVVVRSAVNIDVSLLPATGGLDEVVVVAYGTQKKETVTGAISSVSTREIKQSPAANLAVTLAGRLPGLTTIQSSGEPGRDWTSLFLRGVRSLNGQNPLIMVDGVPRELYYIDPNEVQDVTILKDASSTAMFGVRGANGVILVTTKRGTSEKPEISFSSEYGIQQFNRTPDPVPSWEVASLTNQALSNSGLPPRYTDEVIAHFRDQDLPDLYPDNNWKEMLTNKSTQQQRYNLNVNGSGKAVKYFVNTGFLDQNGLWKTDQKEYNANSSLRRYNFRSNIDLALNKNLTAFLNLGGYLEQLNAPNPGYSTTQLLTYLYFYPRNMWGPLTPDGEVVTTQTEPNPPYGLINRSGYKSEKRANITATYGMEQKLNFITPGLSAKLIASFDTRTNYSLNASQSFQRWVPEIKNDGNGKPFLSYRRRDNNENVPLSLSTGTSFWSYFNVQGFLNYKRTFGDHEVSGLMLYQQDERIEPNDRLPYRNMGLASRFTYGFKKRYFLEFNAGYNGSEQFKSGNRFGFFPSVSGGWIISNEEFLSNKNVISFLKIRGSYGTVGNDRLGGRRFLYLDNIRQEGYVYSGSIGQGTSVTEIAVGNPNIRWEVTTKANFGLELGLFNDLNLSVDIFSEKVNNMLINRRSVSNILGLSGLPPLNIGKMENKGYEIELKYQKKLSDDWSFLSNLNFNFAKNKLIFNDEPIRTPDYAYRYREQGYPVGQLFGLKTDGFWRDKEEIKNSGLRYELGEGSPRPGDLKYIDTNGDGIIDERDIVPIGHSSVPQYTFGAAFSIRYKRFDVSVLFQGVGNTSKFYGRGLGVEHFAADNNVFFDIHRNAWTPERAAHGDKITFPALSPGVSNTNRYYNDYFIWDASFIRLRNFEIGYNVPSSKSLGIQQLRVYVNSQNPFTWDRLLTKSIDPEIDGNNSYPMQRIFNFGLNFIF